jgi:Flp pilus assembly protein TadD
MSYKAEDAAFSLTQRGRAALAGGPFAPAAGRVMGGDDDIARALPEPPLPAPAPRAAAIEQALRRFDGRGDAPGKAPDRDRWGAVQPWRWVSAKPYASALLAAVLVMLIALPVAWNSTRMPVNPIPVPVAAGRGDGPAAPAAEAPRPSPSAMPDVPPAQLAARPLERYAPPPGKAEAGTADAADVAPAPPPPPPALAEAAQAPKLERRMEAAAVASANVAAPPADRQAIATRVARSAAPAPPPPPMATGEEDQAVVVTGTRVVRRGDWNACTVADPGRSLSGCRALVDPAARGAKGRAAAHLADGLARAWQGDFDAAIAAFDSAIALAPKSAFAYLNRGIAYRFAGDPDRALADLDRAVAYAPDEARGYYQRSLVLRDRGALSRARADERRAIDLDPDYAAVIR